MHMSEHKRALYDFSAAIRAEQQKANGSVSDIAEYYMYAGQCNQMLGQYEEALSHYNYGIARYAENWEIFFHRGLAYVSLTNFEKGIEDFKTALPLAP